MSKLDEKLGHTELFPGVAFPLSYDARGRILAAAVSGALAGAAEYRARFTVISDALNELVDNGMYAYLAELLELPADASSDDIAARLHERRAEWLGLPTDTPLSEVLATEHRINRCLTMAELRAERDKRNGTYVPLRNGEW